MRRVITEPRPDWKRLVEELGFMFHTSSGQPYWDESVYYEFTSGEIDELEAATQRLNDMMLLAVEYVVNNRLFEQLGIPEKFHKFIIDSWSRDEITVYGRFDLAWSGTGPPKMLEYNADTPTSLLEAAVIQWKWLESCFPSRDQFNSIHERLVEAWERVRDEYSKETVHFASLNNWEDIMNVTYLRDVAQQAGLSTDYVQVKDIGWNENRSAWVDKSERTIKTLFKLYPWEWMIREEFADQLLIDTPTRWLEAPWKMVLSNKGILPILTKLFPNSPYLLESSYEPFKEGPFVKKPFLSREGANVEMEDGDGALHKTEGIYGDGPFVYQRHTKLANFDGYYAMIGSWMCNGWACGMGIREDESPITGNTSRFVPHLF